LIKEENEFELDDKDYRLIEKQLSKVIKPDDTEILSDISEERTEDYNLLSDIIEERTEEIEDFENDNHSEIEKIDIEPEIYSVTEDVEKHTLNN
jgi:hypothetical protein